MIISHDRLNRRVCDIFAAAGCRPAEPERIAHYLVEANLVGHDSHGVIRIPAYIEWLRAGKVRANQTLKIVFENEAFVALVPFWAVWPFEILLCSRRHLGSMRDFTAEDARALAHILHRVTSTYDKVFGVPFPYSMGFHQSPTDDVGHPECHFHAHFYPPLLRSATIRKFMVGFEMLGTPQRDITPESAAERLREIAGAE